MNEQDPIAKWGMAIKSRLGAATMVIILVVFVGCLIAPIFGPLIKRKLRCKYVLCDDYEERAETDMKSIRVILWMVAALAWGFFFYCKAHYQ